MLQGKSATCNSSGARLQNQLSKTMPAKPPRLYVEQPFMKGQQIELPTEQAHYLKNVLRLGEGAPVLLFNGMDGEWQAVLHSEGKKHVFALLQTQTRTQAPGDDILYLFAPLKQARLDYMAQKATEMGASILQPVMTQNTQVARVNAARLKANAVEAAEQCELLHVPQVLELKKLDACLTGWQSERQLLFCDESAATASPFETLQRLKGAPCAILVGPEGGFTSNEREMLLRLPFSHPISLGPRILRADTAAVAALAMLWQARAS